MLLTELAVGLESMSIPGAAGAPFAPSRMRTDQRSVNTRRKNWVPRCRGTLNSPGIKLAKNYSEISPPRCDGKFFVGMRYEWERLSLTESVADS